MRAVAIAGCLLLLALPAPARDFADAFERDADGDGVPDGWVARPAADAAGKLGFADGHEGRALELGAPAGAAMEAEARLPGSLDADSDYVLSCWILVDGPDGASATLSVQFLDERGDALGKPEAVSTAARQWTLATLPVTLVDSRTRTVVFRVALANPGGQPASARFDEVTWIAKAFVDGFETDLDKDGFPDRWRSVAGDEFPAFNATETKVVTGVCCDGARSVSLSTRARSAGIETRRPVAVDPDRAYALTARVRTEGLRASAAWLEVDWLDESDSSLGVIRSAAAGDTGGGWADIRLEPGAIPSKAAKVRLRLVLGGDDVAGRAWFDDVEWVGHVRVWLDTEGRAGNVFGEAEARDAGGVSGNVLALGMEAGTWEVRGTITDAEGRTEWKGRLGEVTLAARANLGLPFKFAVTAPGPYALAIDIRAPGLPPIAGRGSFAIAHQRLFSRRDTGDYGGSLDPARQAGRRPGAVLAKAGIGRVRVPVWPAGSVAGFDPRGTATHELLLDLRRNGIEPVAILAAPPGASARTLADWFGARDRAWEAPLRAVVRAHGDVVSLWQTGDADLSLARDPAGLDAIASAIRGAQELASPGLAWPADAPPPPAGAASFLAVDLDRALAGLAPALAADPREKLYVCAPATPADLAARAVEARRRGLGALAADAPLLDDAGTPNATWSALAVLNDLLAGAPVVDGELLPGLPVFRKEGRLVVAVRSAEAKTLEAWLGGDVVRVDLLGRSQTLVPDAGGRIRVEASPDTSFLVVRDAAFADTQVSARLEGVPLKSRSNPQLATFRMKNCFSEPLRDLRIVSLELPPRWRPVSPPAEQPELAPSAAAAFPLSISVPSDVRPGVYELRLRVSFTLAGSSREAVLVRSLAVVPEIEVAPRAEPTPDGTGLEVSVACRNRGTKKADFKIYLNRGPGARTLDDVVYALEPGQERIVRFLVEKDEKGKEYLVGLRGLEDDLFVNEAVKVP